MKVADHIARWLHEKDITHAFGIIGGGNVALWEAIARLKKTALISVHHEQAAAMSAAYYYRASGRHALCLVTTGAGSANALTGVLAAWMDSIPLIVMSGNEPERFFTDPDPRVIGTQGYESSRVAEKFVKTGFRLRQRDLGSYGPRFLAFFDNALKETERARPGPVWIDIPKDVQNYDLG